AHWARAQAGGRWGSNPRSVRSSSWAPRTSSGVRGVLVRCSFMVFDLGLVRTRGGPGEGIRSSNRWGRPTRLWRRGSQSTVGHGVRPRVGSDTGGTRRREPVLESVGTTDKTSAPWPEIDTRSGTKFFHHGIPHIHPRNQNKRSCCVRAAGPWNTSEKRLQYRKGRTAPSSDPALEDLVRSPRDSQIQYTVGVLNIVTPGRGSQNSR